MSSKVRQILDPTCEKRALFVFKDSGDQHHYMPLCVSMCDHKRHQHNDSPRAPLPSGTCMFPWVTCVLAWPTRGGSVYSPITDFNIDSNPITDPITDFDECWRLTISSSRWAWPAPSKQSPQRCLLVPMRSK